jgi:hypothetical protein
MPIRTISLVGARTLAGVFGIWVSFTGLLIIAYTLFSPNLLGNLGFLFLNGILLLVEGPIVLMSLRFQRLSVAILWGLFLLRIAIITGQTWQCASLGNCTFSGFWNQLSFGLKSRIIELTFATAFMAQIGYILRKPTKTSGSAPRDLLRAG